MKLVASRDILNVSKLNITPDTTQVHDFPVKSSLDKQGKPKSILKGTRFSIGTAEKSDELAADEKEKVLWLHHSKAAVLASDKAVERIDREVKLDIAKHEKDSAAKMSMEELIAAAVAKALAAAGMVGAAKAKAT